jgi:hypothetical protein
MPNATQIHDIVRVGTNKEEVRLAILKQLTGKRGHPNFDMVTKTKAVQTLLDAITAPEIDEYLNYLTQTFFLNIQLKSRGKTADEINEEHKVRVLFLLFFYV